VIVGLVILVVVAALVPLALFVATNLSVSNGFWRLARALGRAAPYIVVMTRPSKPSASCRSAIPRARPRRSRPRSHEGGADAARGSLLGSGASGGTA